MRTASRTQGKAEWSHETETAAPWWIGVRACVRARVRVRVRVWGKVGTEGGTDGGLKWAAFLERSGLISGWPRLRMFFAEYFILDGKSEIHLWK